MGVPILDLTGEKYGRWTVLYETERRIAPSGKSERMWFCKCECGTERIISQRTLTQGNSTSCGCSRKLDLTNLKFGRLTALYEVESKIYNNKPERVWHCLCECGNEKDVTQNALINGSTKSCGCLHTDSKKNNRIHKDLEGQKFGKWTVLYEVEPIYYSNGYPVRRWKCGCECGTIRDVTQALLLSGRSQSCGCVSYEQFKKENRFDLTHEYGIGYTTKGEEFYFDLEDYDKIKQYCWLINKQGYVVAYNKINNHKKYLLMHRVVLDMVDSNLQVDHVDHNTANNRKDNLRTVTPQQNLANCGLRKNNTSGVTGVSWNKKKNSWETYIGFQGKTIKLGYFQNLEDAIAARKAAEEKYFGEYSYDNSQAYAQQYALPEQQITNL